MSINIQLCPTHVVNSAKPRQSWLTCQTLRTASLLPSFYAWKDRWVATITFWLHKAWVMRFGLLDLQTVPPVLRFWLCFFKHFSEKPTSCMEKLQCKHDWSCVEQGLTNIHLTIWNPSPPNPRIFGTMIHAHFHSILPQESCLGIFEKSNGVQCIQELATTHQFHQEIHSTPQTIQHFTKILAWKSYHPTWFQSSNRVHTKGNNLEKTVLKYS